MTGGGVRELTRTNDPVEISWLTSVLGDAGIEVLVLDTHASIVEGSIGAIPRRLMVLDDELDRARATMEAARQDLGPASDESTGPDD